MTPAATPAATTAAPAAAAPPALSAGTPPILPTAASSATPAPRGLPFLRLGFRPFYLGATLFAALSVPLWVALYLGAVELPGLTLAPLLWHAHEMLFGFAAAVIVGFLLTAGKAWTGLATPRGTSLGVLAGLWLAARLAALGAPYPVYALLDLALLPLVAGLLFGVLWRAGNRRNMPLVGLLGLLTLANLAFHAAALGWITMSPLRALWAALALIVLIECVMGGRVIPAFTVSATPGLKLATSPAVERFALAATAAGLAAWVVGAPAWLAGPLLALAALLQAARQWGWKPWLTRTRPILWILHAAYVWIAIGLALLALAQMGYVAPSAGVHALGVGATGGLIIGMVTRTARGHTGRPLRASRPEIAAYLLVLAAALLRVVLPLAAPAWMAPALVAAALGWSLAFAIYVGLFGPWLARTRADGKDG